MRDSLGVHTSPLLSARTGRAQLQEDEDASTRESEAPLENNT